MEVLREFIVSKKEASQVPAYDILYDRVREKVIEDTVILFIGNQSDKVVSVKLTGRNAPPIPATLFPGQYLIVENVYVEKVELTRETVGLDGVYKKVVLVWMKGDEYSPPNLRVGTAMQLAASHDFTSMVPLFTDPHNFLRVATREELILYPLTVPVGKRSVVPEGYVAYYEDVVVHEGAYLRVEGDLKVV